MSQDSAAAIDHPAYSEFHLQVKQILENFYNFPYLNTHPMAQNCRAPRLKPSESDGQRLRRVFLAAIEELRPSGSGSQKTLLARYHSLITQRYIEAATMQQVAHDLGISERQAYRDLKRAEELLTTSLWKQIGSSTLAIAPSNSSVLEEIDLQLRLISIQELMNNASRAARRLAEQQGISIELELPAEPLIIYTDPRLVQQILTGLLSHLIQQSGTQRIWVGLDASAIPSTILFKAYPAVSPPLLNISQTITNQLIEKLGWRLVSLDSINGAFSGLQLVTGKHDPMILVVDDHPPLIELLRRYLTQTSCQVVGVSDGFEALTLVRSLQPDLIILDVMMPNIDGWEVLQRLHNTTGLENTPVIVCSIFNDPKLAFSLGAAGVLPKPVNRDEFLGILRQFNVLR